MTKYISIFRLVLRCLLVARKENLTGFSTGLTGRSRKLDPIGNPTGFHLWIRYYAFHVWHAAIAYFEIASVAIFSELVAGIAKMLVNQSQELFADVCAYVLAERWIKPYNIARSAFLCIALLLSRLVG